MLCLVCGSVFNMYGTHLGRIKSWDDPNVHDLTHEPPGERFR